MNIHEYYYTGHSKKLYIEFSTKEDTDLFYRVLELDFSDVKYYSPTIIYEEDMDEMDEDFLVEIMEQYFLDNDLPEQQNL
jgi:hypothetical protein